VGQPWPARGRKAYLALTAALLVAACATTPGDLPDVHYAAAASGGKVSTFMAGRPSERQLDVAVDKRSRAVGDSFACGLKTRQIGQAGLVGALELATMSSLAQGGGEELRRNTVRGYVVRMGEAMVKGDHPRPSPGRCEALRGWLPRVHAEGHEAVDRARRNGLIPPEYGLLLRIL
jgi:hypothetical protein